jgi:hypothetical protein
LLSRLVRWLGWSVVLSLTPFLGVYLVRYVASHALPNFSDLFGAGQLLLTSVALTAGGIREIAGVRSADRAGFRDFMLWVCTLFVFVTAIFYGGVVSLSLEVPPPTAEDTSTITGLSSAFLALSMVIGAGCVMAATPKPSESETV